MHENKILEFTINEESTLLDAAAKIQQNSARAVVIVNNEQAVGVVSEGDIMRALLRGCSIHSRIDVCLQRSFKYLSKADPKMAWDIIREHGISLVPVLGDGFKLVHVFSAHEMYKNLIYKEHSGV